MKQRLFLGIFLIICYVLPGYDVILPEDEAPLAIFPTGRSDENVELFFVGSWEAAVRAGCAVQYIPGTGAVSVTAFPDITTGFGFSQTPDLTLSLWYLGSYFFETSLGEDFNDSLFLFGYQGSENDLLQRVVIGNTGTSLSGISYLELPEAPTNSLGALAELGREQSRFSSVLRYDPAEERTQSYRGMNLIEQATLEPAEFIQGRYFALPDNETESLRLFIEVPADDARVILADAEGRQYRESSPGETWVSPARGLIHFAESRKERILVNYDGMTTTGTVLGTAISDRVETINGTDYLILNDPNFFSPFEIGRYYAVPLRLPEESWRVKIYLSEGSFPPEESDRIPFRHYPDENIIALTSGSALPFDDTYKYPLRDEGLSHVYGPERKINPSYSRKKLRVEVLTPVEGFEIDPEYLPSSVRVYRNGYPELDFSVGEDGTVTFDREVGIYESIEIYYSVTSTTDEGGNLVFGTGGTFELYPGMELSGGLGVVWDVLSGTYSSSAGQNPGSILLTGGLEYQNNNFDLSFKAGLSVANPDTTGFLRLKGMEESGFTAGITERSVFPSSVPSGRDRNKRGELYYLDYYNDTLAGSILMDYAWADYLEDPYETGYRTGPYTVSPKASDNISGQLMGMKWTIDGTGGWAGAQVRLPGNDGHSDLSSFRSLSFLWMAEDIDADTEISIQLGALGEDLDGDAILDEETGEFDNGFAFNTNGKVLRVGAGPEGIGNGTLESEDADGDGLLDLEYPEGVVSFTVSPSDPSYPENDRFKRVRVFFSETERNMLSNCTALRVLVTSTSSGEKSGNLLLGEIRFEGSSFIADDESVTLAHILETDLTGIPSPSGSLGDVYPETDRVFHPAGTDQEVLDLRWSGDFSISSPVTPVPPDSYGRLVLYFAPLEIQEASLSVMTVELTDSAGRGIHCSFTPPEYTGWKKLEIDTVASRVYMDEAEINANLSTDSDSGYLTFLSFSLAGSPGGRILLDEIALTDPLVAPAAGAETNITWTKPGTLIQAGDLPIVSDLRLSAYLSGNTKGFLQGITPGRGNQNILSNLKAEATLLQALVSAGLEGVYTGSSYRLSGNHRIRYPGNSDTFIEDRYTHPGTEAALERGTSFVLVLPSTLSLSLNHSAADLSGELIQDWKGNIKTLAGKVFSGALQVDLTQVSSGYTAGDYGYFGGWFHSYRFFLPVNTQGSGERTGQAGGQLSLSFPRVSLFVEPSFSYIHNEIENIQTNKGDIEISLPVNLGESVLDRVLFDITYHRTVEITSADNDSTSFSGDIHSYVLAFGEQSFLLTHIPFYEIFSFTPDESFGSSTKDPNFESTEYTPSLSFSLLRRYGSFFRDLFLPSSADIVFSRELEREFDSWSDHFVTEVSLTSSALNLFGSRGAYPTFKLYETDEYSGSWTLSYRHPLKGAGEELYFIFQGYISFSRENDSVISEHRLDIDTADTGSLFYNGSFEYIHQKPLKNPPDLPFIAKDIEKGMVLSHNELLEARLETDDETAMTDWTVYGRHETALQLPGFGSLSVFGKIGVKPEIMIAGEDTVTTWLAAIETGIEGTIRY